MIQRILVIDDSVTQSRQLTWILQRGGLEVEVIADGRAALDTLREGGFAAVLSDVVMPNLSGYDLCRRIKSDPRLQHIPVILMTTLERASHVMEGLACGADNFIAKPYDADTLLARVRAVLGPRTTSPEIDAESETFLYSDRTYRIHASRARILTFLMSTFEDYAYSRFRERETLRDAFERAQLGGASPKDQELEVAEPLPVPHEARTRRRAHTDSDAMLQAESLAKSRFLVTMSHELRTSLNGIIGMSQLLAESGLNKEQDEYARLLTRSSVGLLRLVDDILDLSKIEGGHLDRERVCVSLAECVNDLVTVFALRARDKGVHVAARVTESVPSTVVGDAYHLRQILANLLDNAVKFTDQGQISVCLDVSPTPDARRVMATFEVEDTGVGIPAHRLEEIFTPFTTAEDANTRAHDGTGLGLSIARQLAEFLDGTLTVQSTEGKGSIFTLALPFESCPTLDDPANEASGGIAVPFATLDMLDHAPATEVRPRRALLVDDNAINRKVGANLLKRLGWECDLAENGEQAVQAVLHVGSAYDVVLMDCLMPVMDGYEAAATIRRAETREPRTPIIAVTAAVAAEDRLRCYESGMDDFVSKPIDVQILNSILARHAPR